MSESNLEMSTQGQPSMSLAQRISLTLTGLLLVCVLCIGIHAGVQGVYDFVEDKCAVGVCVDRVPNGP